MMYNGLSPTINCMLLKYGMIKQTRKCVNKMRHTAAGGAARSRGKFQIGWLGFHARTRRLGFGFVTPKLEQVQVVVLGVPQKN
jgi:hypothetical protein